MKKIHKFVVIIVLAACVVLAASLVRDKWMLRSSLIRLHVVGASDDAEDQAMKLLVRDAVTSYLEQEMGAVQNMGQARDFIQSRLPQLQTLADQVLAQAGCADRAVVTLGLEEFPVRQYDTFTLPSGVYESLRIQIGPAQGRNWWCVVFPSLCLGTNLEAVQDTAAGAGFSDSLIHTITDTQEYEIRFFLLDCLGAMENFFFQE